MTQQSHYWAYTQRKLIEKDMCTPVFTAALFTIARTGNQTRNPSTSEQESCGTYIQWNITQLYKGMHFS